MAMSGDSEDILFLNVEDTLIKCIKDDLTRNSDYFKAMLQGNFVERDQYQIRIEGVEVNAVNIILELLRNNTYCINENDILPVLQASCMLQFDKIKYICMEKVNEMLRLDNCIKIWVVTEQLSLKPLFLKAKLMALQEFEEVKDSESLLNFNLEQILDYLGNVYLKCDNELNVFEIGMKWWYEHSDHFTGESTNILLKILSCLDFKKLDDCNFNEILLYPDISSDENIIQILDTVKKLKKDKEVTQITDDIHKKAQLLYQSKSRMSPSYIAILINAVPLRYSKDGKSADTLSEQTDVVHYDTVKRKRVLINVLSYITENVMTVYYDESEQKFKRFFIIDQNKCENLEGFKLIGYKELVFLFGGQYLIGKGEWNVNFWVYDSIKENWERKTIMPHCRRHFETCTVENKVFITGGIGNFRIIQENTFFYDYKRNFWSQTRIIPQVKCCSFLKKCFYFSAVQKCGYFWEWNHPSQSVIEVDISADEDILRRQSEYAVFSYDDKLYVKGKDLLEFEMENNKLVMKSALLVTDLDYDKMEIAAINNMVYTFYKYKTEDGTTNYSLETLDLQTGNISFIFTDLTENDAVGKNENEVFLLNPNLKLFSITHYNLVEKNTVINNLFRNKER